MTPDTNREAGHRLRQYVHAQLGEAITDSDLAQRLGVSKQAVGNWFAGQEPSGEMFRRLGQALSRKRWEIVRAWDGD